MTTQVSVSVPPGADYFAHVVTEYDFKPGGWQESNAFDVMPGNVMTISIWSGARISRIEERALIDIHSSEYIAPSAT